MPAKKSGQHFTCAYCGDSFYRRPSHITRGITKTCGKSECKSESMRGEGNPFWGRNHSAETMARIAANPTAKPHKRTGPPKGYKHTSEARAKITAALKERWHVNRDKMLSYIPRSHKNREELRYRRNFTPWQRENWKDTECRWCCETDNLILDHIIPVMCGGTGVRENAQTLCQPCNMWKMLHVDRALFVAGLVLQGGRN